MNALPSDGPVRVEVCDDGRFWKIVLQRPPQNWLGEEMIDALLAAFAAAREAPELRATLLIGDGPNFSLGTDPATLDRDGAIRSTRLFLDLIRSILDTPVFRIAVLRGQCMGRGLELARVCNRVYAEKDARVGLPEIEMGLFPAAASVILPERIGRGPAGELCATGYVKDAVEASWMALVDHAVDDAKSFAIAEVRQFLSGLSASSLRLALRALDQGFRARVLEGLDAVEQLYCGELWRTEDAVEGVTAKREGRQPVWRHR